MLKSKSIFLAYFIPVVGVFAFTVALVPHAGIVLVKAPTSVVYNIPKTTMCATPSVNVNVTPENWNSPAAWAGGVVPTSGNVVIPVGKHIILNVNNLNLTSLTINGTLEFARQNLNLTAEYISVMGKFTIGTAAIPFAQKAIITLNGTNMTQSIMGMSGGTRGILVMGGILEMHGLTPTITMTKIADHAAQGATSISLTQPVSWNVSDQIVVTTTDHYMEPTSWQPAGTPANTGISAQRTQITTIPNATTLTFANGLNSQRWGKLQHLTATGMSLSPGTLPANYVVGTPTILDERAEVVNLTRNIIIQSPTDALWQNNGFGCHVMIMKSANTAQGIQGVARLDGVEIKRGGQAGKLGRYPFHWHMLSYEGTATLADVTNQYIRNSTINESSQRGIVIHGTNGAEISKNIVYDIKGHGIFTEDASERRNIIEGNIVMKIRNPLNANVFKDHESDRRFGSSGFWISNPDNKINNNTATDCVGFGFWLAFPHKTFGQSANITPALKPSVMRFGEFKNNVAHSNRISGIHLDDIEIDEQGRTTENQYVSVIGGGEPDGSGYTNVETYELTNYVVWKNNSSGIWNRTWRVANRGVMNADNIGKYYSGATRVGSYIEKSVAVGESLNFNMNGVILPHISNTRVAFSTYNSSIDLTNNIIVSFRNVPGKTSGAFAADDYYSKPIDKGHYRNNNNIVINSHPGARVPTPTTSFAFGLIMDPQDIWGGAPNVDNYYSFNRPFFTHGQTPLIVPPSTAASGGVVITGPFYGVANFYLNKIQGQYMQLRARRYDASFNLIDSYVVDRAIEGHGLQNMRHFAMHPSGIYDLDFQEDTMDTNDSLVNIATIGDIVIEISNMLNTNEYQVMAMEFSGTHIIDRLFASTAWNLMRMGTTVYDPWPTVNDASNRIYQPVASRAAVIASPLGEVYWQDRINNKVWFKIRGGAGKTDPNQAWNAEDNLFKWFKIRAVGTPAPLSVATTDLTNFNKSLKVYPNPVGSSTVSLEWTNTSDTNDSVKIYNTIGQTVFQKAATQQAGENMLKVDASNWASGLYFIQVGSAVVKLIKN